MNRPTGFPGDPVVDANLAKEHRLTVDEYARVVQELGRTPTYSELGVFSVMWSEHCSYKSSRVHLKRLPTEGKRVIQGPGENAGVVDLGDGWAAVFKMESHNHPSFIEPYQGAATGVGGIMRDVFTMGARPVANLNSLRFGRPDHPRTGELVRGVVAGIAGYGNCMGVPTVGGELQFDRAYDGNVLVNAFTLGIAKTDRIFYGRASGVGNSVLYVGAATGRDGIHGATMASAEFDKNSAKKRPTVQVGDPFMEKLLLEACLEIFAEDLLEGIQDMGAAGLTSSSTEMASRAGNGLELDLDRVPRRARAMHPYELLLSESQERMLLVAKPGMEPRVLEICQKWQLEAVVIGQVTNTGRWVVKATPGYDPLADDGPPKGESVTVCDLPVDVLTEAAPKYDRPRAAGTVSADVDFFAMNPPQDVAGYQQELLTCLGSPNIGSRRWIYRQYDHMVRGGTLVRPGSDAAVVRIACEVDGNIERFKTVALSVDCSGRYCELDARRGAAMAVAECARNVACSGAEPIGLTDCLNFGNPERPEVMQQISDAVDGIAEACISLGIPVVSGNVSLYNETVDDSGIPRGILPTPTVAVVGLLRDPADVMTSYLREAGLALVLLGAPTEPIMGGSEYALRREPKIKGTLPSLDLALEGRLQKLLVQIAQQRLANTCHDVSEGGLATTLAELCVAGEQNVGAAVNLPDTVGTTPLASAIATLFSESPSRVVVATHRPSEILSLASSNNVPAQEVGVSNSSGELTIRTGDLTLRWPLETLRETRERCLESIVGT